MNLKSETAATKVACENMDDILFKKMKSNSPDLIIKQTFDEKQNALKITSTIQAPLFL